MSREGFDATNGSPAIRINNPDPVIVDESPAGGHKPGVTFGQMVAEYGLSIIQDDHFTYIVAGPVHFPVTSEIRQTSTRVKDTPYTTPTGCG